MVTSAAFPTNAVFSPDGRWVAYQSGDQALGEATTYVEPFPPTGAKYEIARAGRPIYSWDGKELFFVPAPGQFRVVSVRTDPVFGFTPPVAVPRLFGLAPPMNHRPYDMLPDGRLVAANAVTTAGDQRSSRIHVVLNWFEELTGKGAGAEVGAPVEPPRAPKRLRHEMSIIPLAIATGLLVSASTGAQPATPATGTIIAQAPCAFTNYEEASAFTRRYYSRDEYTRTVADSAVECLRIQVLQRRAQGRRVPGQAA